MSTTISFEELKTELLARAKKQNACVEEYRKAAKASNEEELLAVIKENLPWCSNNGIIDHAFFEGFTQEIYFASGIANSGKENSGFANTGYSNTGDRNTGDRNTGSWNTGSWNTGYRNTGYSNTGSWNTGDRNTGSWNTGSWNTGSWNTGYRNTGYSNTGDRNTGVFCTGEPTIKLFNKESNWTLTEFENSDAYRLLCRYVDTKQWIQEEAMTDEEKENHIGYKTAGGYYKDIPFKEAFTNAWHNWNDSNRNAFRTLPNFDVTLFEEITGVKDEAKK